MHQQSEQYNVHSAHPQHLEAQYRQQQQFQNQKESTVTFGQDIFKDSQKESLILISLLLVIHSEQFQSLLQKNVPALFRDQKISSFGTLLTGIGIVALFNMLKNLNVNFGN
jgi:hypothetical protein